MQVTQLHTFVNAATQQILGETALVNEDLSNLIDVGKTIFDSNNVDNYVKKLVNHIGKVVFVSREYLGGVPSVLMDAWEFGSVLQKVSAELPAAVENKSWDLTDGEDYSPNVFYKPSVEAKFFNSKTTFEINVSFTETQVKESFSSAEQLNAFISMLQTAVQNSMTVKLDSLIMRTINNMVSETCVSELYDAETQTFNYAVGGAKNINLLAAYNAAKGTTLTVAKALADSGFIAYATYQMGVIGERMKRLSVLFNVGGRERFTPEGLQKLVLLADFSKASETLLASNTFNAEKIALPAHDSVPYWQGSGLGYSLTDVSTVKNTFTRTFDVDGTPTERTVNVDFAGILGVMFDRDALGVTNLNSRVTTNYNPKAEFYNNFYKLDAGFFNDLNENFVVFYMA